VIVSGGGQATGSASRTRIPARRNAGPKQRRGLVWHGPRSQNAEFTQLAPPVLHGELLDGLVHVTMRSATVRAWASQGSAMAGPAAVGVRGWRAPPLQFHRRSVNSESTSAIATRRGRHRIPWPPG